MLSLLFATVALAQPAPQAQRPQCVVDDYTVSVRRVAVTRSLLISFGEEGPTTEPLEQMVVYLEAKGNTEEAAARLCGFDPAARLVTDTGVTLEATGTPLEPGRAEAGAYRLEAPPEDAATVAVEGELVAYAFIDEADLEFGLDEADVTEQTECLSVTFQGYGTPDDPQRARFHLVITPPEGEEPGGPRSWPQVQYVAALIGADGTECTPNSTSSSSSGGPVLREYDFEFGFAPPGDFQPARISFRVTVPIDPSVRVPFRIGNVPLPRAPGR